MIKIMIGEIWRTAISDGEPYEGYKVSNLGRILSLNYRNTGKAELMNPYEDTGGYLVVNLSKNGEYKTCYAHRLVAEAFLPNPEGKPEINHKIEGDEGKKINIVIFNEDGSVNNEKTSIEWVTRKENNDYGTRNERAGKANTNGKCSKKVLQFTLDGEFLREWPSTKEIERQLGFNNSVVGRCCRGKIKSAYGYIWKYKETL